MTLYGQTFDQGFREKTALYKAMSQSRVHGAPDCLLDAVIRSNALLITFQHAAPAQVTWEIAGGHAMKASHPALQSAVD
ncbi:hypothetical protein C4K20_3571 [Pseudomonas chlororaphis subsp. aurantiaca]|nr:hypothetical protein C4K20_3571 [Pseudomonas chlororaphis subsp. aurantiaca]